MPSDDNSRQPGRPAIEWIFGALSACILAAIIMYLGYSAIAGDPRPPDLVATVEEIRETGNGAIVVVSVANQGDRAASRVGVEATIRSPDGSAQSRQIEFDYVAGHAVREGAFVMSRKGLARGDVTLVVHGFVQP